jgi:hypothetical protein
MAALVRTLAATGDRAGAEMMAREWATLEPADAEARLLLTGLTSSKNTDSARAARTLRVDPASTQPDGRVPLRPIFSAHEEIASATWAAH